MVTTPEATTQRPAMPPPTHPFAGSDSDRQSVGDPGHCERCAVFGHVVAHPDLGCGDVGCTRVHSPEDEPTPAVVYAHTAKGYTRSLDIRRNAAGGITFGPAGRPTLALTVTARDVPDFLDAIARAAAGTV